MRKISFSNLSSGQIGQLFRSLDIHLEEANRADDEDEEVPYQAECGQSFENHWKGSILLCGVHRTIRILGIRKPLRSTDSLSNNKSSRQPRLAEPGTSGSKSATAHSS